MDAGEGSRGPRAAAGGGAGPRPRPGPGIPPHPGPEPGRPGGCRGKFWQLRRCPLEAPWAPLREGGQQVPRVGRLGGAFSTLLAAPLLPLVSAHPSGQAEVLGGQGALGGEGHAEGRDPTEAGATGRGAGRSRDGRTRTGPGEARSGTPTPPLPAPGSPRLALGPGWGAHLAPSAAGPPAPPRPRPRSGWNVLGGSGVENPRTRGRGPSSPAG